MKYKGIIELKDNRCYAYDLKGKLIAEYDSLNDLKFHILDLAKKELGASVEIKFMPSGKNKITFVAEQMEGFMPDFELPYHRSAKHPLTPIDLKKGFNDW